MRNAINSFAELKIQALKFFQATIPSYPNVGLEMGFILIFVLINKFYVLKAENTSSIRKETPMKSEPCVGGSTYKVESTKRAIMKVNKMQIYRLIYYSQSALHISDDDELKLRFNSSKTPARNILCEYYQML